MTIDCVDVERMANFWQEVLGYERRLVEEPYIRLFKPRSDRIIYVLILQTVPEAKTVKHRVHLDLASDDVDVEVERLVSLGATVLTAPRRIEAETVGGRRVALLADPEGGEFCVTGLADPEASLRHLRRKPL
jgi:predicted enzyme related to lactoylglutathione lyase